VPVVAHPGLNFRGRGRVAERLLDFGAEGLGGFNARHKRTAPLNQRGEIADLRCIVVVVEDLQPLGPEVEQSLGHTFPGHGN